MSVKRLTLRDLTISNGALPLATISFAPGLNLIIGASGTGKTFVFEAIDFMLGAKDGLRRIPEADGYVRVSLSVDPSERSQFTLRRAFDGGNFELAEFGNGRNEPETVTKTIKQHPFGGTGLLPVGLPPRNCGNRESASPEECPRREESTVVPPCCSPCSGG